MPPSTTLSVSTLIGETKSKFTFIYELCLYQVIGDQVPNELLQISRQLQENQDHDHGLLGPGSGSCHPNVAPSSLGHQELWR